MDSGMVKMDISVEKNENFRDYDTSFTAYKEIDVMESRIQNYKKKHDYIKMENPKEINEVMKEPKEKPKVVWFNVAAFGFLHLICLYSICMAFSDIWRFITLIYALTIGVFISGLGITMGAHRLWSHRSFKAKLPLRLFLLFAQTMAGQNCLWTWVRDHRLHHKYSDTDADPHNSKRGFFFSHMGWLMMKKHPEVLRKGKQIDMSDLDADPWIIFQKKYYMPLHLIISLVIPVSIPYLLWGQTLWSSLTLAYVSRLVISLNCTWTVNSLAHMYGNKPYEKEIIPVQNPYVAFFALGEGWHNFHHVFPWDCNASEYGQYFNLTSRALSLFAYLGLAYDLKMVTKEMIMMRLMKHGDGSHPLSRNSDKLIK